MKRPVNFEKINHKTFTEDAIEYSFSIGADGLWLIATDAYKSQFTHAILLDMMWDYPQQSRRAVGVQFCKLGKGSNVDSATSETITQFDLSTMDNFIEWGRMLVNRYRTRIRK